MSRTYPSRWIDWDEFVGAILRGDTRSDGPADGLAAMATLRALYESARTKTFVSLESGYMS